MEPICNLKEIYKALYQFEKEFLDTHKITINEAMVLCCMKEGEMKSAGAICEFVGLSNSRVSKVITSVENKNFIYRTISTEDKRQMLFALTEEGKEKICRMQQSDLQIEKLYKQLAGCIKRE
ncbi:MAG: winged helix DNA-binding protein [Bacteroides sp.]|nr:winged helix DNA-binding protein [Bacteroides sp.]